MKESSLIGSEYKTTEGYTATIIEYNGWYNSTVRLNEGTILTGIILGVLRKGNVKNPNHKTVFGRGYFGQGKYISVGEHLKTYITWRGMMGRCYDPTYHAIQPTYIGCSVAEEWHNYQNFAKWHEENYVEGWQLDKDYHMKGNKIYSPETCVFIPQEVNSLITNGAATRGQYPVGVIKKINRFQATLSKDGTKVNLGSFMTTDEAFKVYKEEKEKYIKEMADKWKNMLTEKAYESIIRYQIEITD